MRSCGRVLEERYQWTSIGTMDGESRTNTRGPRLMDQVLWTKGPRLIDHDLWTSTRMDDDLWTVLIDEDLVDRAQRIYGRGLVVVDSYLWTILVDQCLWTGTRPPRLLDRNSRRDSWTSSRREVLVDEHM